VITYAFHDIDGTHSLIRDWPPVMSIVLNDVIENGLKDGYDSEQNVKRLVTNAGTRPLPETDRFCVESAGLSALTQMEWAIRRAVEEKTVTVDCDDSVNSEKIGLIWQGREELDYMPETEQMRKMLLENTPRLFRYYEKVLNGYCRDKNLVLARKDPDRFRIKGSFRFLKYLKDNGVKNYFVTGAVVQKGMGMFEEVETLGYKIGKDEIIEDIIGSTWTDKLPKNVIMNNLLNRYNIKGENTLVVGDGRSEIQAGVEMGSFTISRLSQNMQYQKELHINMGTNMIVEDFEQEDIYRILAAK
jgi:phosphoglycolate phosphatase-like HAD superfamily hydrolase